MEEHIENNTICIYCINTHLYALNKALDRFRGGFVYQLYLLDKLMQ